MMIEVVFVCLCYSDADRVPVWCGICDLYGRH